MIAILAASILIVSASAHSDILLQPPSTLSGTPSKSFSLIYHDKGHQESSHVLQAAFQVNSKHPTIVLDHYGKVNCLVNSSTITLDYVGIGFQSIFKQWKLHEDDLAFVIGHEAECKGKRETQSFKANSLTLDAKKSKVLIQASALGHDRVFDKFEVTVKHIPVSNSSSSLSKRSTLAPGLSWDMNYANNSYINYNKTMSSTPNAMISCLGCYATGNSNYEFVIQASYSSITAYEIRHYGAYKTNIDYDIDLRITSTIGISHNLASIPFAAALIVPGVITLVPSISLDATLSLTEANNIYTTFGFNDDYSYDFQIKSDPAGVNNLPIINSTNSSPIHSIHKFSSTSDKSYTVAAGIVPSVSYKVLLFGYPGLSISFGVASSVGVEVFLGKDVLCPADKQDYEMFSEVTFAISRSMAWLSLGSWTFIDSGKMPFNCSFCRIPGSC